MKKIGSIVFIVLCVLGALIAGQLGRETAQTFLAKRAKQNRIERSQPNRFERSEQSQLLRSVADELNRNLPAVLDKMTRLDSTTAIGENQFLYSYTVLGVTSDELDDGTLTQTFAKRMQPQLLNNYRNSASMKLFRDLGVELIYAYRSESGSELTRISISPDDF